MLDRVVVLGCVLLLCMGLCFGLIINYENGPATVIKDIFEFLSFVATIAACIAAIVALRGWRAEFRYSKSYDCLSRLKSAAKNVIVVRKYFREFMHYQLFEARKDRVIVPQQKDNFLAVKAEWDAANAELLSEIEDVDLFVGNESLSKLMALQSELSEEAFVATLKMIEMIFETDDLKISKVHSYQLEMDMLFKDIVSDIQWLVNDLRRDAFKRG